MDVAKNPNRMRFILYEQTIHFTLIHIVFYFTIDVLLAFLEAFTELFLQTIYSNGYDISMHLWNKDLRHKYTFGVSVGLLSVEKWFFFIFPS